MTDLQLVLNISEALCEAVPNMTITLSDVPNEFVRMYNQTGNLMAKFDRYKMFDNGSSIRVSTLPF